MEKLNNNTAEENKPLTNGCSIKSKNHLNFLLSLQTFHGMLLIVDTLRTLKITYSVMVTALTQAF